MDSPYNISFQLLATVVEDEATGFFSATCPQFPKAFAQGNTKGEPFKNLIDRIPLMLNNRTENSTANIIVC